MPKATIVASLAVFLAAGAIVLTAPISQAEAKVPSKMNSTEQQTVVLELFTSQGCSSCPPADALLSKVGRQSFADGVVIPLAFHVDYWNRIGWTDPFSSRQWSQRQGSYAAVRKTSEVYTPQLVLNGTAQVVGNNERLVRQEIFRQLKAPRAGTVSITSVTPRQRDVEVDVTAALKKSRSTTADLYVVVFENDISTAVRSGENSGRKLVNDYIVRSLTKGFSVRDGGTAGSQRVTLPLNSASRRGGIGIAAFLQDPQTLEIHAATSRQLLAR